MDTNVNVTDTRLATHKRRCAYEALFFDTSLLLN
jgi:hypothetical protein